MLSEESNRQLAVLSNAVQALEALGSRPWLTDGTLLGYWRERDFIAHDHDMDLGMLFSEWSPAIIPTMETAGFRFLGERGQQTNGLEYTFIKNDERLDIFFFYEFGDTLWHAAWLKNKIQINYSYPRFELFRANFLGLDVWIPQDPESYVLTKYGPNWRIPDKRWSWAYSPKNRQVPVRHWPAFLWQYLHWRTKTVRHSIKRLFRARR